MPDSLRLSDDASLALAVRWSSATLVYRPVTELHPAAPLRLTVPAHGASEGEIVQVTHDAPPWDTKNGVLASGQVMVIDADTLELNAINASGWHASHRCREDHITLVYRKPIDMTGMSIIVRIREAKGHVLATLAAPELDVDVAGNRININLSPAFMDALGDEACGHGHHHRHPVPRFIVDIDAIDTGGTRFQVAEYEVVRGKP